MNLNLTNPEIQQFIQDNEQTDVQQLLLKGIEFEGVSSTEVAQQIIGIQVFKKKAPSLVKPGVLYPPKINIEQTSSELTAKYKQELLPENCESFADLTGGFGVDCFFMTEGIQKVTYCEQNEDLARIASHNFKVLDREYEVVEGSGVDWLMYQQKEIDCIYIDPSRREGTKKVISLEQSEPNVLTIWEDLLVKAKRVIVKLSPMLDLTYLQDQLPHLMEIHVVAIKQDVKELILVAEIEYNSEVQIIASSLSDESTVSYQNKEGSEISYVENVSESNYIYEPFSVILKAGLQDEYASQFGLNKIDMNTHLYASKEAIEAAMCKQFNLLGEVKLNRKAIQKFAPDGKINVVCRNYALKPEQVLKKLKLKQGGDNTLFCFRQNSVGKLLVGKRIT